VTCKTLPIPGDCDPAVTRHRHSTSPNTPLLFMFQAHSEVTFRSAGSAE